MLDSLMAPLPKHYCKYFYIAGIVSIMIAVFAIFSIFFCIGDKKKAHLCFNLCLVAVQMAVGYLVNRMLYNMCIN